MRYSWHNFGQQYATIPYTVARFVVICAVVLKSILLPQPAVADDTLRLATFRLDVTPPLGSPLCDALVPPAAAVDDPLSLHGLVLLPSQQQPIVLVAIDWVGIGNEGHDAWRAALAKAANTDPRRVCVHALHQHDAPGCDFTAERIAAEHGLAGKIFDVRFARQCLARAAQSLQESLKSTTTITHIGQGEASVVDVASNRRILGPDGRVIHTRYTACKDPAVRAFPAGTVDTGINVISFWNADGPQLVMSYFAIHPQSYYGQGHISCDFVGLARELRQRSLPQVPHIHFNGAGGNVGAGKFNDGSVENRPLLAQRLAEGMQRAWESTRRSAIEEVNFQTLDVALPPAPRITTEACQQVLGDPTASERDRIFAARDLAWLQRCQERHQIVVARLRIGSVDILHLPGELFVEYQLAARAMRPQSLVCLAAYGDYGPGYIGLHDSYQQGGYETGRVSRVAPEVETILMTALQELLK